MLNFFGYKKTLKLNLSVLQVKLSPNNYYCFINLAVPNFPADSYLNK